jgi:magnesium transporter
MENQAVILEKMITSLLNEKKYPSLRDILVTMNPSDIASVFGELEPDRIPLLFRLLPKEQAAETFVEMDPEAQELLIQGFSDSELKEVVVPGRRRRPGGGDACQCGPSDSDPG